MKKTRFGRPADYQMFTMAIYNRLDGSVRYHLADRYRKRRKHPPIYVEVCKRGSYVLAEHEKLKGRFVESHDDGDNWRHGIDWSGTYEVPKCICTRQPEG